MSGYGHLDFALQQKGWNAQPQFTIGLVVDSNDPQQNGRLRVWCPGYGDKDKALVEDIPWAMPVSPLGGMTNYGTRGHTESEITGPVAYGMWNVPKEDAYVLVGCVDGDSSFRFWIGCIMPTYLSHTMPHGRYTWMDDAKGLPDGPVNSFEEPVEPLYTAMTRQFTQSGDKYPSDTPSDPRRNMEWRSRGVDTQVSAIFDLHTNHPEDNPGSLVPDHQPGDLAATTVTQEDGTPLVIAGPGYSEDLLNPELGSTSTGEINYDSHIYSWTTPGFHSYSMDDRPWNNRVRIRTTSGHQIILDDTNERIYINTSGGDTWIELDKVGNIDIHATKNVSMHAGGDINYTTDKSFRVHAKEGIHMYTANEFRVHAQQDVSIHTAENLRIHSLKEARLESDEKIYLWGKQDVYFQVGSSLHLEVGESAYLETGSSGDVHIKSGRTMYFDSVRDAHYNVGAFSYFTSTNDTHILAQDGNVLITGINVSINGPPATPAEAATAADSSESAKESQAYWTSRVPQHEPWGRVFMKKEGAEGADNNGPYAENLTDPNVHVPEYPYTSTEINKGSAERGDQYDRTSSKYWRR